METVSKIYKPNLYKLHKVLDECQQDLLAFNVQFKTHTDLICYRSMVIKHSRKVILCVKELQNVISSEGNNKLSEIVGLAFEILSSYLHVFLFNTDLHQKLRPNLKEVEEINSSLSESKLCLTLPIAKVTFEKSDLIKKSQFILSDENSENKRPLSTRLKHRTQTFANKSYFEIEEHVRSHSHLKSSFIEEKRDTMKSQTAINVGIKKRVSFGECLIKDSRSFEVEKFKESISGEVQCSCACHEYLIFMARLLNLSDKQTYLFEEPVSKETVENIENSLFLGEARLIRKLVDEFEDGNFSNIEMIKDPVFLSKVNEKIAWHIFEDKKKMVNKINQFLNRVNEVEKTEDKTRVIVKTLESIVRNNSELEQQNQITECFQLFEKLDIGELKESIEKTMKGGFETLFRKICEKMSEIVKLNQANKTTMTIDTAEKLEFQQAFYSTNLQNSKNKIEEFNLKFVEMDQTINFYKKMIEDEKLMKEQTKKKSEDLKRTNELMLEQTHIYENMISELKEKIEKRAFQFNQLEAVIGETARRLWQSHALMKNAFKMISNLNKNLEGDEWDTGRCQSNNLIEVLGDHLNRFIEQINSFDRTEEQIEKVDFSSQTQSECYSQINSSFWKEEEISKVRLTVKPHKFVQEPEILKEMNECEELVLKPNGSFREVSSSMINKQTAKGVMLVKDKSQFFNGSNTNLKNQKDIHMIDQAKNKFDADIMEGVKSLHQISNTQSMLKGDKEQEIKSGNGSLVLFPPLDSEQLNKDNSSPLNKSASSPSNKTVDNQHNNIQENVILGTKNKQSKRASFENLENIKSKKAVISKQRKVRNGVSIKRKEKILNDSNIESERSKTQKIDEKVEQVHGNNKKEIKTEQDKTKILAKVEKIDRKNITGFGKKKTIARISQYENNIIDLEATDKNMKEYESNSQIIIDKNNTILIPHPKNDITVTNINQINIENEAYKSKIKERQIESMFNFKIQKSRKKKLSIEQVDIKLKNRSPQFLSKSIKRKFSIEQMKMKLTNFSNRILPKSSTIQKKNTGLCFSIVQTYNFHFKKNSIFKLKNDKNHIKFQLSHSPTADKELITITNEIWEDTKQFHSDDVSLRTPKKSKDEIENPNSLFTDDSYQKRQNDKTDIYNGNSKLKKKRASIKPKNTNDLFLKPEANNNSVLKEINSSKKQKPFTSAEYFHSVLFGTNSTALIEAKKQNNDNLVNNVNQNIRKQDTNKTVWRKENNKKSLDFSEKSKKLCDLIFPQTLFSSSDPRFLLLFTMTLHSFYKVKVSVIKNQNKKTESIIKGLQNLTSIELLTVCLELFSSLCKNFEHQLLLMNDLIEYSQRLTMNDKRGTNDCENITDLFYLFELKKTSKPIETPMTLKNKQKLKEKENMSNFQLTSKSLMVKTNSGGNSASVNADRMIAQQTRQQGGKEEPFKIFGKTNITNKAFESSIKSTDCLQSCKAVVDPFKNQHSNKNLIADFGYTNDGNGFRKCSLNDKSKIIGIETTDRKACLKNRKRLMMSQTLMVNYQLKHENINSTSKQNKNTDNKLIKKQSIGVLLPPNQPYNLQKRKDFMKSKTMQNQGSQVSFLVENVIALRSPNNEIKHQFHPSLDTISNPTSIINRRRVSKLTIEPLHKPNFSEFLVNIFDK